MDKQRVVVAMSGGVDSSVAAAFLKEKGYDVIGLTMKLWGENNRCCSEKDIRDARTVANHLNIPHYTISLNDSFQKHVVNYFISEYEKGRTPNPCAVCNPAIKFGDLLKKALELKAQFIATGHYAINTYDKSRDRYLLKRGKERGKDQSYFLARLSQEALKHVLFPIGSFPKNKIRKLASRFGLPVAMKTESQEICFIPDGQIVEFIARSTGKPLDSGPIVNQSGEHLGSHPGIIGYTIGQRKGLGISTGEPLYVTKIEAETNTIVVGDDHMLYHDRFTATDPHWISITDLKKPIRVKTRIRYKHRPVWSLVSPVGKDRISIRFETPQRAITPGQLAVFYEGDIVVGSAWIEQVIGDTIDQAFG